MKIRRKDFKTYTRQSPIRPATQETRPLLDAAAKLLDEWLREQPRAAVRLLGVGARDLTSAPQLDLFTVPEASRNQHLDAALDDIRAKFGKRRASRAAARCATVSRDSAPASRGDCSADPCSSAAIN